MDSWVCGNDYSTFCMFFRGFSKQFASSSAYFSSNSGVIKRLHPKSMVFCCFCTQLEVNRLQLNLFKFLTVQQRVNRQDYPQHLLLLKHGFKEHFHYILVEQMEGPPKPSSNTFILLETIYYKHKKEKYRKQKEERWEKRLPLIS